MVVQAKSHLKPSASFAVPATRLTEWDLLEWIVSYALLYSMAERATHTRRILEPLWPDWKAVELNDNP